MEAFLGIICIVFGILNLILFFKVWGMTNDVDKITNYLTSPKENDIYLTYLKHYTEDMMPILRNLFELKEKAIIAPSYESKTDYLWVEDYEFEILGFVYCIVPKASEHSSTILYDSMGKVYDGFGNNTDSDNHAEMVTFRIGAKCNGDPRVKSNWSYQLIGDTNIAPESLKRK